MLNFQYPCDVFILAGQSNAEGNGLGESDRAPKRDERALWLYDPQSIAWIKDENGNDKLTLVYPSDYAVCIAGENKGAGNLAYSFAERYIASGRLKEGRKLLFVKAAIGGTGFVKKQWRKGDTLYNRMLDMTDDALALHEGNRLVGFLWHQGECDAFECPDMSEEEREQTYFAHFSEMVSSVRARYGVKDLPVIAGGFVSEWASLYQKECAAVERGTKKALETLGWSGFAEAADLQSNNQRTGNGDNIHFCRDALVTLGERYFEQYEKICK